MKKLDSEAYSQLHLHNFNAPAAFPPDRSGQN